MLFLGNPNSLHLDVWKRIYSTAGLHVEGLRSINIFPSFFLRETKVGTVIKSFLYVALGFLLRVKSDKNQVFHAHGASGYGLTALLAGRQFVVTIYGSEIFGAHNWIYNKLVERVLLKSSLVTVTSAAALERVLEIVPGSTSKICCFHTGVDCSVIEKNRSRISPCDGEYNYVLSLRSIAPHYRIESIIRGFLESRTDGQKLILLKGNGHEAELKRLKEKFDVDSLVFIDRLISPEEMLAYINHCDYCVNFPISDQLSTTLLEALLCNKKIVTVGLPSYSELIGQCELNDCDLLIQADSEQELVSAMKAIVITKNLEEKGSNVVRQYYSTENAASIYLHAISEKLTCQNL